MNVTDDSIFTMPLTRQVHQTAQQFSQQHTHPQKIKQVYLNTLAVQAVNTYLEWMGVPTQLEASDSWNPALQSLANVADLALANQGKLECRPVLPGDRTCHIPAEVWSDRLGYVAVQFDAELTEATLLGFVPSVQSETLPLEALRSLDELFDYLTPASQSSPVRAPAPRSPLTHLSQWLETLVDTGWKTLDSLFETPQVALSMRGGEGEAEEVEGAIAEIQRGKPLILGSYEQGETVVLLVGIFPHPDREWEIWVKVAPSQGEPYLPADLQVFILDEMEDVVMQAHARQTEMIQLRFSGIPGERFNIRLVLGNDSLTESFVL